MSNPEPETNPEGEPREITDEDIGGPGPGPDPEDVEPEPEDEE